MYLVSPTIKRRLLAHIDCVNGPTQPNMTTRCWPWTGHRNQKGYGTVRPGGHKTRSTGAHRVMYEVFVGPIEPGNQIDHECEWEPCCNPEHLNQIPAHLNNHYRNWGRHDSLALEPEDETFDVDAELAQL